MLCTSHTRHTATKQSKTRHMLPTKRDIPGTAAMTMSSHIG